MMIQQREVRELLFYDPETGIFTWRERGRGWFKSDGAHKSWNSRDAGKIAGSVHVNSKGFQLIVIRLIGRLYSAHRLAWLYMTDEPLPDEIDHINRDATDNRWYNLRASSRKQNSKNKSKYRTNTSGVSGVHWHKKTNKWMARCKVGGRRYHLGYFNDIEDAAQKVADFRSEQGFSVGHGQEVAHYVKGVK